jgi:hypothetical protein
MADKSDPAMALLGKTFLLLVPFCLLLVVGPMI